MLLLVISTYAFRDIFNLDNNNNNSLPLENVTKILNELNVLPNIDKKRSIYTDDIEWEKALNVGEDALKQRDEIEERMRPLDNDHPSYKHQKLLATSMKIRNITRIGFKEQRASEYLKRSSEYLKRYYKLLRPTFDDKMIIFVLVEIRMQHIFAIGITLHIRNIAKKISCYAIQMNHTEHSMALVII